MGTQFTIVIFFDTTSLGADRFDLALRERLVERGIARLAESVPYVSVITPNPTAAAVTVTVNQDRVGDLITFLDANAHWLSYEFDGKGMFRAAKADT